MTAHLPANWDLPKGSAARATPTGPARPGHPAPSKYRNKEVRVNGVRFASHLEYARWLILDRREREGTIRDLRHQPRIKCVVNGRLVCTYVGDFAYTDVATGAYVIEDTKGIETPVYRLKARLVLACHGLTIRTITRADLHA